LRHATDATSQAVAYTYFRKDDEARQVRVLTHDEARRIAANRPPAAIFAPAQAANSMPCSKIPYATEQGIFGAITGNFRRGTGNFLVRAAIAGPCQ
jgi:hypothetical protein